MYKFGNVEFRYAEIRDKEEARQNGQNVMDHVHDVSRQYQAEKIEERENDRRARYGQSAEAFRATVLAFLAVHLQHVEECESDDGAKHQKDDRRHAEGASDTAEIKEYGRLHAKADHVRKGVELYAEIFFVCRAVLFRARDRAVKHIANT